MASGEERRESVTIIISRCGTGREQKKGRAKKKREVDLTLAACLEQPVTRHPRIAADGPVFGTGKAFLSCTSKAGRLYRTELARFRSARSLARPPSFTQLPSIIVRDERNKSTVQFGA